MKLVLASANKKKAQEVSGILPAYIELVTLEQVGIAEEIPETGQSFEENAMQKARFVFERTGLNVIADDSGLEVKALKNAPGIYSARYAGEQRNDDDNIQKLLKELKNSDNRRAGFRCAIALIMNGNEYIFEGQCKGNIIYAKRGNKGFGYDPVFIPDDYEMTFAELDPSVKNQISHRAKAIEKLIKFLSEKAGNYPE